MARWTWEFTITPTAVQIVREIDAPENVMEKAKYSAYTNRRITWAIIAVISY
jgi:hypothetical protein